MNETVKNMFIKNSGTFIVAIGGAIVSAAFFVLGFILSLRADLNATQFQVQALQKSIEPIQSLVSEVSAIRQKSDDTNEKVNILYNHLVNVK